MSEGLSASEAAKEIGHHASHHAPHAHPHDRLISIAEAVLLAVVALTAAWAGYSAAKWSTESRLSLAKASTVRTRRTAALDRHSRRVRRTRRTSTPGSARILRRI